MSDESKPEKKKMSKRTSSKKEATSTSKLARVKSVLAKSLKDDEGSIVDIDPEVFTESLAHFSTTSLILDRLISGRPNAKGIDPCPGWPKGRIIQLYGPEGSGKTTLGLHFAKSVIQMGGCVGYLDFENEIIPEYARAIGVPVHDTDKFQLFQPSTFEEGASIMWALAHADVELMIIDSIPAAVPKALVEKTLMEIGDRGQVGANAAAWSAFLPRLRPVCRKHNVTLLGISQIRASISQYGPADTIPGGNAWKFYSALRMRLQKREVEKTKMYSAVSNSAEESPFGNWVQAKLDKCKISCQQGAEAKFFIRYGEGVDNLMSLIQIGMAHKVIRREGAWYRWTTPQGEELAYQGEQKLWAALKADVLKASTLEKQIRPHLANTGIKKGDTEEIEEEELEDDESFQEVLAAISESTTAATSAPKSVASSILQKMKDRSASE